MRDYIRQPYNELLAALEGRLSLIQAVLGPRQVAKTTLALQLFKRWRGPKIYETADQPDIPSLEWINPTGKEYANFIRSKRSSLYLY